LSEVVAHPQVAARGAIVEVEHPSAGKTRMVGPPIRLSATPGAIRSPAPRLGEHTALALREVLGLDDAGIADLRATGALGK
jgi:crotonobetainyl-CoA:carnitine CoA-transferase CaiB-like acyl-CoA transferase